MNKKHLSGPIWIFSIFLICGCSSEFPKVKLTGSITIDGVPVDSGTVTFLAEKGETSVGGGGIKDGQYVAQVPPGEKIVLVRGSKLIGQTPSLRDVPDSPMVDNYELVTHPDYDLKSKSPLRVVVENKSSQVYDIELHATP